MGCQFFENLGLVVGLLVPVGTEALVLVGVVVGDVHVREVWLEVGFL